MSVFDAFVFLRGDPDEIAETIDNDFIFLL